MKKYLSTILATAMLLSMLASCGSDSSSDSTASSDTGSTSQSATTGQVEVADSVEADFSTEPDGVVAGTSATHILDGDFISSQFPGGYAGGQDVYGAIYDTLFYSPSGDMTDITGLLVDTYTISEDYLSIVLDLHEDVYFTNGNNLTASSVVESFNYRIDEGSSSIITNMVDYEVTGEYQVTLYFALPNVNFMTELSQPSIGIFDPTMYLELGAVIEAAWEVGSGPYYISDYAIGDYFILTAKEDHWCEDRQAHIETITCKVISNTTTAMNAISTGESDTLLVSSYENMESLMANENVNIIANSVPNNYRAVWINNSDEALSPYLANARVREALSMMIDMEEACLAVGGIYATLGTNPFTPAVDYQHTRTYDPDAALAILAEEGVDPSDIVLTALCSTNDTTLFTNLQAQFMESGVTVNFISQDTPAVMTAGANGEWDLWCEHGGAGAYNLSSPLRVLMGETASYAVVKDPELAVQVGSLVTTAFSSTSLEEQAEYILEICQILDENYIYIGSMGTTRWYAFSDRIANPTFHYSAEVWQMWKSWIAE